MRVLFRTDASREIGMGHLSRCLAFAEYLREKHGADCEFLLSEASDTSIVRRVIEKQRFKVHTTPLPMYYYHMAVVDTDYSGRDYTRFLYEMNTFNLGGFTICLMGNSTDYDIPADLIVAPYRDRESDLPNVLAGQEYFIFSPLIQRGAAMRGTYNYQLEDITVSCGGSDPHNLARSVAWDLRNVSDERHTAFNIHFIIGPFADVGEAFGLTNVMWPYRGKYAIKYAPSDMAPHLMNTDLVIGPRSHTMYEAQVLGTPYLTITTENRERFKNALRAVALDYGLAVKVAMDARKSLDTKGLERICSRIPQEILSK